MTAPRKSDAIAAQGPPPAIALPQPIGVPADYAAIQPDAEQAYFARGGIGPPSHVPLPPVAPRFFEGDDWSPASLPAEQLATLQQQLVDAGALKDKYRLGLWDDASRAAYRDVLAFANASGLDYNQAVSRFRQAAPEAKAADSFKSLPFRDPDRGTLRQLIKQPFKELLNRDPSDDEASFLESQYRTFLQQRHQQDEQERLAEYNAQTTDTAMPATIPQTEPSAAFTEYLSTRYKPETDLRARQQDNSASGNLIGKSLSNMASFVGSGRV